MLIVGGSTTVTEIFDPATLAWTTTTAAPFTTGSDESAALLPNGKVLLIGAGTAASVFDPGAATWTATGAMSVAHSGGKVIPLANGRVLFIGGSGAGLKTDLFDPTTSTFSAGANTLQNRYWFGAVLLNNGQIIMAGGYSTTGSNTQTAELY